MTGAGRAFCTPSNAQRPSPAAQLLTTRLLTRASEPNRDVVDPRRLFAFLDRELGKGRYAVADVRAKKYTGFEHLQGLNVSTPFGVFNANLDPLNRPHHSWVGKTTCCEQSDPFGNPCPEVQMSNRRRWDWCPLMRRYQQRPKHDGTRARILTKCNSTLIDPSTGRSYAANRRNATALKLLGLDKWDPNAAAAAPPHGRSSSKAMSNATGASGNPPQP